MKKITFSLLFFLLVFTKLESQTWNLIWSDEFTNTTIDMSNWSFETGTGVGGWGNNELEYYTNRPENATISNGKLLIIARKEPFSGSNYTSARMKTQGKKSWTYGKIEAKIKFPNGNGIWPAFWMLGDNITQVGWPQCGEIDIMEHVNSDPQIHGTIHWYNNSYAYYGGDTTANLSQYHVYGIEWDQNGIAWFLDGNKYWEANISNNINGTNEFHAPFFILLNMAVGGNWPGNPDPGTNFPDTLFVDYVRVYQKSTIAVNSSAKQDAVITLFPDPATENITLNMDNTAEGEHEIKVFDVMGKLCFQRSIFSSGAEAINLPIPLDKFNPGVFFITIRNKQGIVCRRFVKT